jgi:arginine-tRNA-protein transferase
LGASGYRQLLERGYRRFGQQLFRPACKVCHECISLRVIVPRFRLTASYRRILRQNANIRAELHPVFASSAHVQLLNRYQAFMHANRGWDLRAYDLGSYREAFIIGADGFAKQWLYMEGAELRGVALMDEVPQAISLVYFFYDPEWRDRSPGTFSILTQLLYAQQQDLQYAYLGYAVERCQSLRYKGRFRPHEVLVHAGSDDGIPRWRELDFLSGPV